MSASPAGPPPLTPGAGPNGAPPNGAGSPTWTAPLPSPTPPPAPPQPEPSPPRRRRTPLVVGGIVALVAIVVVVVLAMSGSGSKKGKGETFGNTSSQTLAPVRAFTPQTLHEALLKKPFPPALLPPGFSFDPQRSPNGMLHAGRAFSDPAKDKEHHVVGTAVLSL